jgi:hypothetical protein
MYFTQCNCARQHTARRSCVRSCLADSCAHDGDDDVARWSAGYRLGLGTALGAAVEIVWRAGDFEGACQGILVAERIATEPWVHRLPPTSFCAVILARLEEGGAS